VNVVEESYELWVRKNPQGLLGGFRGLNPPFTSYRRNLGNNYPVYFLIGRYGI